MTGDTTTRTLRAIQLTPAQREMAKRHGAMFCDSCGRPTWTRTGPDCDTCTRWAAEKLHTPLHVPGETGRTAIERRSGDRRKG